MTTTPVTAHALDCDTTTCDVSATCDTSDVPLLFASPEDARRWARDHDWMDDPDRSLLLCPPCAEQRRLDDDQAEEIAAAIRYATEELTS